MTVAELIHLLKQCYPTANIQLEYQGADGCDSCGYGGQEVEDVVHMYDWESRVVPSCCSCSEM
jgi:hypothetical protein